jgi:hypothetical protein
VKITTQQAWVYGIGIIGLCGLIFGLVVWGNLDPGAIVALASGIGSVIVLVVVQTRNQQKTTETLENQDRRLDTIVAQTNGLSEIERNQIAEKAATRVVQKFRNDPGAEWRRPS